MILSKHGPTKRIESSLVGGAISNAEDAKNIPKKKRYEAVSCACSPSVMWLVPSAQGSP